MEILATLWKTGPATVRQVHEELNQRRRVGYTTVLKLLQLMSGKGLVIRDEHERAHIYRAAAPAETTRKALVGDLLRRAYEGAAGALALHALGQAKPSREELAEIRRLVDEMEEQA